LKTYYGQRRQDGCLVLVAESDKPGIHNVSARKLNPRFDLANHSPTGFEWGYGGSGPAQLALALLAHALDDDGTALDYYQQFKFAMVARLPHAEWALTERDIKEALEALKRPEAHT